MEHIKQIKELVRESVGQSQDWRDDMDVLYMLEDLCKELRKQVLPKVQQEYDELDYGDEGYEERFDELNEVLGELKGE